MSSTLHTYKLNVKERLVLPRVLPQQSDYAALATSMRIADKVKFSQDEEKEFGIETTPMGGVNWSPEKSNVEVEFEFTADEEALIVKSLDQKEKEKKLDGNTFTLYEKFVAPKPKRTEENK